MSSPVQLSTASSLSSSDQIIFYSTVNGSTRRASLATLLAWFETNFASPQFVKQYASPNVNGTNVQVASTVSPTWLLLTPTGPFAAMTITLPAAAQIADGIELLVFCSQAIAALTMGLNGASAVYGAPAAIAANSSFKLRYNATDTSWYISG